MFVLSHPVARENAIRAVQAAPDGFEIIVREPTRNALQNRTLHGLLSDIVKARTEWAGQTWDIDGWKALMVSAWAIATKHDGKPVPGLESEFVVIRRSTARMSKRELSSLIEYITFWMVSHNIPIRDGRSQ